MNQNNLITAINAVYALFLEDDSILLAGEVLAVAEEFQGLSNHLEPDVYRFVQLSELHTKKQLQLELEATQEHTEALAAADNIKYELEQSLKETEEARKSEEEARKLAESTLLEERKQSGQFKIVGDSLKYSFGFLALIIVCQTLISIVVPESTPIQGFMTLGSIVATGIGTYISLTFGRKEKDSSNE